MKVKKHNVWKLILQWGTLAAIVVFILYGLFLGEKRADIEAYCPFGGLQAFGSYLHNNSLTCSMSMVQIMIGVCLAMGVILFSKLFCGYLCPLGTLGEWMGKAGAKLKVQVNIPSGSIADRALRLIKYVLLFVVFYMSVSSSELFCKNFDPYYAMASGFQGEITVWMTLISLTLLFAGSLFFRMFWCKYICPLGALSNIFKFTLTFAVILLLMWAMGLMGFASAWIWGLGAACLLGYLWEVIFLRSRLFPLLHIVRDTESCNGCGVCTRRCPYQIDLKNVTEVRHIDCTLCGECVTSCAQKSLSIGSVKAPRWVPALIVVALFAAALVLGHAWELPTIDEKWGSSEQQIDNLEVLEMDGLTSIKCYGSSKAFSAKMQKVPGVYGVRTFVKHHRVEILYNPSQTDSEKIRAAIFTPTIQKFENPAPEVEQIGILHLGVDKLFDRMDMVYFANILKQIPGVYGFDAEYACPVAVTLYVDPTANLSEELLEDSIEVDQTHMLAAGNEIRWFPVDYKLVSFQRDDSTLSRQAFIELMFKPLSDMSGRFTENIEQYADTPPATAIYEVEYPAIEKTLVRKGFPYFKSFLSTQPGILSIDVALKESTPVLRITYDTALWNDASIWEKIFQAPQWTIKYTDGSTKEEDPKMKFKKPGVTLPSTPETSTEAAQ